MSVPIGMPGWIADFIMQISNNINSHPYMTLYKGLHACTVKAVVYEAAKWTDSTIDLSGPLALEH